MLISSAICIGATNQGTSCLNKSILQIVNSNFQEAPIEFNNGTFDGDDDKVKKKRSHKRRRKVRPPRKGR